MSSASNESRSPLARLVLFLVCLSMAGSLPAGAGFAVFKLPEQIAAAHPPSNYGQICTTYSSAFWAKIAAFFQASQGCVYGEHDYGDFIIYDVCCPK
jgi:hypothetical protein